MRKRVVGWLKFILRWGIAIAGIYIIIYGLQIGNHVIVKGMTWRDHALVLDKYNHPVETVVVSHDENSYVVRDAYSGRDRRVPRALLVNEPDAKSVVVRRHGKEQAVALLGADLRGSVNRQPELQRLLVAGEDGRGEWIGPWEAPGYQLKVPHPLVITGLKSMLRGANPWLIALALLIFPITFLAGTIRWHALQAALDIHITLWRTFVLNMVGAFYNTFMPGSTGGDLVKALYASRQTDHKTRAVMCVLIDRIIGLLTLVMMGGAIAGLRYLATRETPDPATHACGNVALACLAILVGFAGGTTALLVPGLRRGLGLEFVLGRLPMQQQVLRIMETLEMYRRRPGLMLWAVFVTLPVHATVAVSAMLCGMAFGLNLTPGYYFVVVPVVVLVGSLPLSPQGAGVMEFFAILLVARQGATVSQAFALTMSIRMVQVLWNMTGGIFVLAGGFHAPTQEEKQELEKEAREVVGA